MRILILGGTQFLGRHFVEAALTGGHEVTLFNRGKTNPTLFPEVEKLTGDRNGDLEALRKGSWDAAVDTSGFVSTQVVRTATLLADCIGHYTFISSISVYRNFRRNGLYETAELAELPKGAIEEQGDSSTYGARKVLCEQAAEAAMPGRLLNVRPGIIVGPHDTTGRFTYWIRRMAEGGPVLAPGDPEAAVQLIDARDLALWILRAIQENHVGAFNATGLVISFGQMLGSCNREAGNRAELTWVGEQFLLGHGIKPFSDLPFWIPSGQHDHYGFFAVDSTKAIEAGLVFRPFAATVRDTLDWMRQCDSQGEAQPAVGLDRQRELSTLAGWKAAGLCGRNS
jgi:2'-hydroxyisoflavone reductase